MEVNELFFSVWRKWKELFLNVCNRHAPYKRKIMRGVKCPWLTGETKKLMNQRDFLLRKARRSRAEVDWNAYRRLRNQVSNKIRNEKRRYQRNEIQDKTFNYARSCKSALLSHGTPGSRLL